MERLRKFLLLPNSERWLLVKVTILLSATSVGLRLLPFRTIYRLMGSTRPSNKQRLDPDTDIAQISAVVNKAGQYFLGKDSCFPQALTGEMLLRRNGHDAKLRIGVVKESDGSLRAHAWVENEGEVVIGGPILHVEKYTPLPELDKNKL